MPTAETPSPGTRDSAQHDTADNDTADNDTAQPDTTAAWKTSPMFAVWTVDGTVVSASESYAQLVGMTPAEVIGRRWPDLVPEEEKFSWQQLHFSVAALRTAPVLVVDMPTRAAGSTNWLRWTEWAIRDEAGELVQVRSTAVDVSELHEVRAAFAATLDAVVAARVAGRREVVEQLHNGAVQQLTAARWALSDGDLKGALGLIDSALAAVRSSVDALDPPEVAVSLVSDADMPAMWIPPPALGRDELPAWLAEALSTTMADSVLVVSSAGVVWASSRARAVFGDPAATIDLGTMLSLVHEDDRAAAAAAVTAALAGEPAQLLWRFRHPLQGGRHLSTRFASLPALPDGTPIALAVTIDITDQQLLALEAARVAERERIASDLHDDALQQLAGLRWMLLANGAAPDVLVELDAVETSVRSQVTRLRSAVADLGFVVAVEQLLAGVRTPVVHDLVGDLDEVPVAVGDRMWRALRELLRNVDRHSGATQVWVRLEATPTSVALTVTDDGVGVSPEAVVIAGDAGHVGLATIRELALARRGSFEVASQPGGGTRVTVVLPRDVVT